MARLEILRGRLPFARKELGLITGAFIMLGRLHRTFGVAPMGPHSHAVLERGYDA